MDAEIVIFGFLGLIVGSFLNVVILRHGARSLGGRSGCMACGAQLRWYEMIPVLSWFALRGRCRVCHTAISIQYPLVEFSTGILFALIGGAPIGIIVQIISLVVAALLVIIFVYDLYHTIIPDEWVYALALFAFAASIVGMIGTSTVLNISLFVLAGPLAALPLFALWFVSRGRWMGLGDPKLALGIGWLLGVPYGLYAVFFAFVIGAVVSVCILLPFQYITHMTSGITRLGAVREGFTMKSEVPFGPFLIASCVLVWFAMMYGIPLPFLI